MYYNSDAGDVIGIEMLLSPGKGTTVHVYMQCAEGAPDKPIVIDGLLIDRKVKIPLPEYTGNSCYLGQFEGTISSKGIVGKFLNNNDDLFLPKRESYWSKYWSKPK